MSQNTFDPRTEATRAADPFTPLPGYGQPITVNVAAPEKPKMKHGIHIVLSVLTLGTWLPVWLLIWLVKR